MEIMDLPYNTLIRPYNKPITPLFYNKYFNPNICHVCKKKLKASFKECECNMISYCCKEHKEIDREQHHQLCGTVFKVKGHKVLWNTHNTNMAEWVEKKKKLLALVQKQLKRELEPFEKQMFLFVKSCFICHRRPEEQTNFCKKCYCVNYCNVHKDALNMHKFFCSQMKLCLSLDLDTIEDETLCLNFINKFPDSSKHLCDMVEFIKQYVTLECDQQTWFTREFLFTDYTSGPLTVFYGLKEVQLIDSLSKNIKNFIIHFIGAKPKDTLNFPAWELLLHLLKFPLKLMVIMIGPELNREIERYTYNNVCAVCIKRPSKLQFEFYPLMYSKYVNSLYYKQPDIIIGFDIKLDKNWQQCIKKISILNCPLLLTAKSRAQAQRNIEVINDIFGAHMRTSYDILNKFHGHIPHRDSDTEFIYFINKHLTIYKCLRNT